MLITISEFNKLHGLSQKTYQKVKEKGIQPKYIRRSTTSTKPCRFFDYEELVREFDDLINKEYYEEVEKQTYEDDDFVSIKIFAKHVGKSPRSIWEFMLMNKLYEGRHCKRAYRKDTNHPRIIYHYGFLIEAYKKHTANVGKYVYSGRFTHEAINLRKRAKTEEVDITAVIELPSDVNKRLLQKQREQLARIRGY